MTTVSGTLTTADILPGSRFDHLFFSAISILILVCVFIGFAPTYYLAGVFHAPLPNLIIHIHGPVFSCWILLLVIQTTLVSAHRVDLHRRIGMVGFGLACVMTVVGLLAGASLLARNIGARGIDPKTFYVIPFTEMVLFPALVLLAYRARRDSGSHKRYILIATVVLLGAAFARFHVAFLYRRIVPALLTSYCFLVILAVYDWWSLHKLHRATVFGSALVLLVEVLRIPLAHTGAWQAFASWVQAHSSGLA